MHFWDSSSYLISAKSFIKRGARKLFFVFFYKKQHFKLQLWQRTLLLFQLETKISSRDVYTTLVGTKGTKGATIAQWIRIRLPSCGIGSNPKHIIYLRFLSAAEGQRPRNYSSCSCWIFCLICLINFHLHAIPNFLNILNYHSIYLSLYLSLYLSSTYPCLCLSIYHYFYLSIYQSYTIAADPEAGIGLVL